MKSFLSIVYSRRLRKFCFIGYLVFTFLIIIEIDTIANKTAEYSRITSGGKQSETCHYKVNDSITRTSGASVQKSSRFKVISVKSLSSTASGMNAWEIYK